MIICKLNRFRSHFVAVSVVEVIKSPLGASEHPSRSHPKPTVLVVRAGGTWRRRSAKGRGALGDIIRSSEVNYQLVSSAAARKYFKLNLFFSTVHK